MRILCCKKYRRRRRRHREANAQNTNVRRLSLSCSSSSFNTDSSSSSFSDDFSDNYQISGDHSSILAERGCCDNFGFSHLNDESQENNRSSRKFKKQTVINRKYDAANRYEKANPNDSMQIKSVSNKEIDFQSYNLNDILSRISVCGAHSHAKNQFKTGQPSLSTIILDSSNLNDCRHSHDEDNNEDTESFSSQKLFDRSLDDKLSLKLDINSEIPPPYDQIVHKESTV